MSYPSNSESVAQDQLVAYVRRIESIEDEKKVLNEDLSEIYKEARGNGFDVKVLRKVIADRRKDATERAEFETIYELYWSAVHGLVRAHVENIEEFDVETGEVLDTSSHANTDEIEGSKPQASVGVGVDAPSAGTGGEEDRQPIQHSGEFEEYPSGESGTAREASGGKRTEQSEMRSLREGPEVAPPTNSVPPKRQWKHSDPAHPDCLDPGTCGGFSNNGVCGRCKEAAAGAQTA